MTIDVEERDRLREEGHAITVERLGTATTDRAGLRRWRRRALAAGVGAVAAVTALVWQATRPAPEPTAAAAAANGRDQALIAAIESVEVLNTLDHRDVESGLDAWASVTTGELHDQIAGIGGDEADALADAGAISTGRVIEAAVLELDAAAGTAAVIAFTEVTVTPGSGADSVERHRYAVDLERVDGDWLVAALVPVELEQ